MKPLRLEGGQRDIHVGARPYDPSRSRPISASPSATDTNSPPPDTRSGPNRASNNPRTAGTKIVDEGDAGEKLAAFLVAEGVA